MGIFEDYIDIFYVCVSVCFKLNEGLDMFN